MRYSEDSRPISLRRWFGWLLLVIPILAFWAVERPEKALAQDSSASKTLPKMSVIVRMDRPAKFLDTTLAKYEPASGCYLGAYIDLSSELEQKFTDVNNKKHRLPADFEAMVKRPHAIYFFYLGYGQRLPVDWVRYLVTQDKFVHVALEPNSGLDSVQEDEYLNNLADEMRRSGARIFLRFASEMNGPWVRYNGDPEKYVEKWRLVTKIMRARAPNVAMVWCPYATPVEPIDRYYPGDEWVDWVGVNMYNVSYFNQNPNSPAFHIKPDDLLRYVYQKYSAKKPVMIGEYGTTHFSALEDRELLDFAKYNIKSLYRNIETKYPRVKAINYFNTNNLQLEHRRNNNYSVTHQPEVLKTYQEAIDKPFYLERPIDEGVTGEGPIVKELKKGAAIRGRVTLTAYSLNVGNSGTVDFQVDGASMFTGGEVGEWTAVFDTTQFKPGKHTISVIAYDGKAGKEVERKDVVVTFLP